MITDSELLERYAQNRCESAFAELVKRYVDLVYSAALRQVGGDAHLAQDVTQNVFVDLARKAASLSRRTVLTGWLYTSTRYAAVMVVRGEQRRRMREQEAHVMQELLREPAGEPDWNQLRPVLDDVMNELNERDRDAVLLRYFEGRRLSAVGTSLGLSEDAARMRIDRALEKLRILLSKRGISTTLGLATVLSANAVHAAPAGLVATLTTASLTTAAAGTGTTLTILKLMAMTKIKAGIVAGIIVAGAVTPFVIQHQTQLREQNEALYRQMDELSALKAENERLSNALAGAGTSTSLAQEQLNELLRLRGEIANLRQQTNDLGKLRAESEQLKTTASPVAQTQPATIGVPRESWTFAGYADPESAFQSAIWARSQGDVKAYLASITPNGSEFRSIEGKPEESLPEDLAHEVARVSGFDFVDREVVSDDEVILTIYAHGVNDHARFRLQRISGEWKLAGPAKGKKADRESKPQ